MPEHPVEAPDFRAAMATLASGLVVVTTRDEGRPWGMTVTACCSVSAEPPLVLVSVHQRTRTRAAIGRTGRFGLNVLAADQHHVAHAASRPGLPKFLDEHCARDGADAPRVEGAMAFLDCRLQREVAVGDHVLVIGAVEGTATPDPSAVPLLYFDRTYHVIGAEL